MPNTYTQLHIQIVFAVKYRAAQIDKSWKDNLHKYITGIVQNNKHKILQINSMPDHIHIFIGMRPDQALSALVQNIKSETSKCVKENKYCKSPFYWQEGFGAFSYAKSKLSTVINYKKNQEQHHSKKTFLEEYIEFLDAFEVEYDERFLFRELE